MEKVIQAFLSSLESQRSYSKSTRAAYGSDLRYFVDFLHKIFQRSPTLADFNQEQVSNFFVSERQAGRRKSTLLRRRATLRRFYEFLRRQGLIDAALKMDLPMGSEQAVSGAAGLPPTTHLSSEQIQQIISALQAARRALARRDLAIFIVLLETGMSVSSLIGLDIGDVDFETKKIHYHPETGQNYWIPSRESIQYIENYLKEGRPELNADPDEQALFISQMGARMSRQSIWQVLRHWGRIAHLPVLLSPRVIRYTAAYRLVKTGLSCQDIQALLGHTNPLSTLALLNRMKRSNVN